MFSSEMTELSITRENASAMPARIIVLSVAPISFRITTVASAESGIDSRTAPVARTLPRNSRIMMLGQDQSDQAFVHDGIDRFFDEHRLIEEQARL